MSLVDSLIFVVGVCMGIPIGMQLEKIGFSFWRRNDTLSQSSEVRKTNGN